MTKSTRRYADLTAAEVPQILSRDSVLIIPTGAIEPHGPHLPLSTDIVMAEAVGNAVVDRAYNRGHDVWLMPALTYTKSDEHSNIPGTIWLTADTLLRTITDIGRSIAATPARRIMFVNCHGGNSALLEVACRELRRRFDLQTFLYVGAPHAGPTERGFGIHAGCSETSMMLHVRPELVNMTFAERSVPESIADNKYVGFGKSVRFGWLADDFAESGVIGDPTGATAETGRELFEAMVTTIVDAIAEVEVFNPGRVSE